MSKFIAIGVVLIIIAIYAFYSCNLHNLNKHDYYENIALKSPDRLIPEILYNDNVDLTKLDYPVVFKPDVKSAMGNNVVKIHNADEATDYIRNFDYSGQDKIIISKFIPWDNELSIQYEKMPIVGRGRITSIMTKNNSKKPEFQPAACSLVGCFDSSNYYAKYAKPQFFKNVAQDCEAIPNMSAVKLDIIYKDEESLLNGEYLILELNGSAGIVIQQDENKRKNILVEYLSWISRRLLYGIVNICTCNDGGLMNFAMYVKDYIYPRRVGVLNESIGGVKRILTE